MSQLEMWANAQRDGRPAEYTWHPLFNAAKFGSRLLLQCCALWKAMQNVQIGVVRVTQGHWQCRHSMKHIWLPNQL